MKPNFKYMTAIFLVGLFVGGTIGRVFSPGFFWNRMSPEKREARKLKHFSSKLNLDAQQKEAIGAILKSRRVQMEALLSDEKPKFEAIRNSAADEIRKVLNPEQKIKFEEMHKKHEERMKKRTQYKRFPPY